MILIRADGSGKMGSGHLMRCMTIAEWLREKEDVLFLTSSFESSQMVEKRGFKAEVLKCCLLSKDSDCSETGMSPELRELTEWIEVKKPDWVFVDSYQVDEAYLTEVSAKARTVYLDDFGAKPYPVDLIINYNVYAKQNEYEKMYGEKAARFLIGPAYIPIRSGFTQESYRVREEIKNILILTGGGDYYQLAMKMMKAFGGKQELRKYHFHLICGYYNNQAEELRREAGHYHNFEIYENVPDIWNLMRECDLAVTAGGTTVYELCAMGLPFLGYSFADNQKPVLAYMQKNDIAPDCGDYREKKEELFETVAEKIALYEDLQVRRVASKRQRELVDGQGARRIADSLQRNP